MFERAIFLHRLCGKLRQRLLSNALIAMLAAVGLSCSGKSSEASLSGTITFKGSPINGVIILESEGEGEVKTVRSAIAPDGSYRFAEAPVGKMKIGVVFSPRHFDKNKESPDLPSKEQFAQYGNPSQSGLTVDIHSGANNYSVDLQ